MRARRLAFHIIAAGWAATARAQDGLPPRDQWQRAPAILEAMHIAPGQHVADVAAGTGYLTKFLAQRVGKAGRVYAVEIGDDELRAIRKAWRSGALLVIVDNAALRGWFRTRDDQASHHALDPKFAVEELRDAGFEIVDRQDTFIVEPYAQWMIVARRP